MGSSDGRTGQGRHLSNRDYWLIAVMAGVCAAPVYAAESARKVDADLLEFLGSIDTEEAGWQEYLEHKPVKPVAKKPQDKPAQPPAKPEPKPVKTTK